MDCGTIKEFWEGRLGPGSPNGRESAETDLRPSCCGLGVNSTKLQRAGHAIDGNDVGGDAVAYAMRFRCANHLIETLIHNVLQSFVDFTLTPKKSLTVLNPFK